MMSCIIFLLRSLTVLAILVACTDTAHSDEQIPVWAEESSQAYYKANDASDANALAELYAVDAMILVSSGDPGNPDSSSLNLQGRDEIAGFFGDDFENTRYECEWEIIEVVEGERLAAVSGKDTCAEIQVSSGDQVIVPAEWLTIYKKDASGNWLIYLEHY
jgi:ketosteroid isomerase-like protein